MALPTNLDGTPKELVVERLDPEEMTLDELCLFDGEGFTATGFLQFLVDHTNWTKAEAGKIKVKELRDVAESLGAMLQAQSVPLGS